MKKLILIFTILATSANAECVKAPDMGDGFYRCQNKEAVCYLLVEKHLASMPLPISCFRN